jgi:hypothetical protein
MQGGQAASSDGVDSLAADSIDVVWGGTTFDENTYLQIFFPPSPVTVVPEVETGALMLAGLASVGAISRRRRRGREAPSALIVDSRAEMERGLTSLSDPFLVSGSRSSMKSRSSRRSRTLRGIRWDLP